MAAKLRNPGVLAQDTRLLPAYSYHEAARYLRLPVPTLRSWCVGLGRTTAVFKMDDPQKQFLSFMNLVEAHILAAYAASMVFSFSRSGGLSTMFKRSAMSRAR